MLNGSLGFRQKNLCLINNIAHLNLFVGLFWMRRSLGTKMLPSEILDCERCLAEAGSECSSFVAQLAQNDTCHPTL